MPSIPMSAEAVVLPSASRTVLSVADMSVQFKLPQGWITAVDAPDDQLVRLGLA